MKNAENVTKADFKKLKERTKAIEKLKKLHFNYF